MSINTRDEDLSFDTLLKMHLSSFMKDGKPRTSFPVLASFTQKRNTMRTSGDLETSHSLRS